MFGPSEIYIETIKKGKGKAGLSAYKMLLLGFMAGMFIAFAAEGSNMAAFNLFANPSTYGLGKFVAGLIFPVGLVLVLIAGGELFTGNTLMIAGVLEREISVRAMLKSWVFVYIGNFIGSIWVAFLMVHSGLFHAGNGGLGEVTVHIAEGKVGHSFMEAMVLGILCNILVCLAVWISYGAKDMTGKILASYLPIFLFITSGFEHSIANMYYIPAGIMAKTSGLYGGSAALTWQNFIVKNLVPVTIGNIIGGAVFVGGFYALIYHQKNRGKICKK